MKKLFHFLTSRTFLLNLIIAILLIVGSIYFILRYLDTYTMHGQKIEVPRLTGYHVDELSSVLDREKLQYSVSDSIYVKEKNSGEVLEQHPEYGSFVKSNRTIYVTIVSSAPTKIKMPNLVDLSLRQAQTLMESYGLEVGELTYQPDVCKNCVLEQKIDGEIVLPNDKVLKGTVVDLTVGQGVSEEKIRVPYCIDLTLEEAGQVIKLSSLNVGAVNFDETVINAEDSLDAKVYRQIPYFSNDPSVSMGSSVDLFLTMDSSKIVHRIIQNDSIP